MPLLATLSSHVSALLHNLIFSFPSPSNATEVDDILARAALVDANANSSTGLFPGVAKMVQQPSEHRALAGGIGPLTFAGSGYGVILVLMALLMNRIHHIVRRPRIPPAPYPHPVVNSLVWKLRRKLTSLLISRKTPRYIRLPGIICLARAVVLFTVVLLQVANLWPVSLPSFLPSVLSWPITVLGDWAGDMQMGDVCWQVFLSVNLGLICSGLAEGLDHRRRGGANSGFNLFGYAFLLHLYSSPLTHHHPPPTASHGRPDIHPLFQLWLGLLELTWLQAIELSDSLRGRQLVPTAICGSLGLAHFVYVLITSPLKFPSFTFLTHLLALFLSIIIVFTVTLTAFTHIFTVGYIPSPIWRNLLPHEGVMPRPEDDFGVALLKLGTACMWSSKFGGMRNELVHVAMKPGPWIALSSGGSAVSIPKSAGGGFGTEITQIEVEQVVETRQSEEYHRIFTGFFKALWAVSVNATISLLLKIPGSKKGAALAVRMWYARWWYGPRHWRVWRRAAWTWRGGVDRRRVEALVQGQRRAAELGRTRSGQGQGQPEVAVSTGHSTAIARRSREASVIPYDRFLRGEVEMEDDDEDWENESEAGGSASDTSDRESDDEEFMDEGPSLHDFLPSEEEDTADFQPVLLAHLTSSTSSPLTRRRYQALLHPSIANDHGSPSRSSSSRALTPFGGLSPFDQVVLDRRAATADRARILTATGEDWDDDRRKCCVICTVEPRDTILWPCRCLALCGDCRESLAARMEQKEHLCPCCRKKVDGYSRIFVP